MLSIWQVRYFVRGAIHLLVGVVHFLFRSKFEIVEVDCTVLDFDTVVSAITSNDVKFGCDSVALTFTRPSIKQEAAVTEEQSEEE